VRLRSSLWTAHRGRTGCGADRDTDAHSDSGPDNCPSCERYFATDLSSGGKFGSACDHCAKGFDCVGGASSTRAIKHETGGVDLRPRASAAGVWPDGYALVADVNHHATHVRPDRFAYAVRTVARPSGDRTSGSHAFAVGPNSCTSAARAFRLWSDSGASDLWSGSHAFDLWPDSYTPDFWSASHAFVVQSDGISLVIRAEYGAVVIRSVTYAFVVWSEFYALVVRDNRGAIVLRPFSDAHDVQCNYIF
jgi:hypothetical protein